MSHELRTPLNSIIGFSETLKVQMFGPLGDPKYIEYASDINASGTHLLDVINDILDISKIEAGEVEVSDEAVDLPTLVESAIKMLREQAEDRNVTLSRIFPSDCPRLRADPRHIKQIVINLVSNAVKFTPPKGTIKLEISKDAMNALSIIVEDTGIGIKPENIATVLEPFGQVGDIYSRSHEGTGQGLPLAKSLAELHGGTVKIVSQPGQGTTVTIRFPRSAPSKPSIPSTPPNHDGFAVGDIKPAGDDETRPGKGPGVGQVAPDDKAENHRPDYVDVLERRQKRCLGPAKPFDQQEVGAADEHAAERHQAQVPGHQRGPAEWQRAQPEQDHGDGRKAQDRHRRFVRRNLARGNVPKRPGKARAKRQQGRPLHRLAAGADHDQDSE